MTASNQDRLRSLVLGVRLSQAHRSKDRALMGLLPAVPLAWAPAGSVPGRWVAVLCTVWVCGHTSMTVRHWTGYLQRHPGGGHRRILPNAVGAGLLAAGLGVAGAVAGPGSAGSTSTAQAPSTALRLVLAALVAVAVFAVVLMVSTSVLRPADPERTWHERLSTSPHPSQVEPDASLAQHHEGLAIACSGGGIRAAAFCLGGIQRLLESGHYQAADRVYAVSGGSYIATSLHLARRHSAVEGVVPPDLFAPTSPEADWLRRKSSFLLPSRRSWFRGLYSIAFGLITNLTMVVAALWLGAVFVVWGLRTLPADASGVTGLPELSGPYARFNPSDGVLTAVLAALALAAVFMVAAQALSKYRRVRLPSVTPVTTLLGFALLGIVSLVALPATLAFLHNAAVSNQPSQTVAKAVRVTGLVSARVCDESVRADFAAQAKLAWGRAPDPTSATSLPFHYGACGDSFTDDALAFPAVAASGRAPEVPCPRPATSAAEYPAQAVPQFCDPVRDSTGGWGARITGAVALLAALSTLLRGILGQSDEKGTGRTGRLWVFVKHRLLPWTAGAAVFLALVLLLLRFIRLLVVEPGLLASPATWVAPIVAFLAIRLLTDATTSSLHPFYRERLHDTFLIKREGTTIMPLRQQEDTAVQVDPPEQEPDGPALTVLCVANISDVDYVPAQRSCVSFRFETASPRGTGAMARGAYIGVSDTRLPQLDAVRLPAEAYSLVADPGGNDTTLSAAVAASGAAFSPLVGRQSKRVRPYRFLMTLANARLGVWLPNPYYALSVIRPGARLERSSVPGWLVTLRERLVHKPGPFRIFKEAFGAQSVNDSRLYVTDGGHFDNTGMVEALRDRPRRLVVLDASADAEDSLDALADAITTARMDLGLAIAPRHDGDLARLRRPAPAGRRPERAFLHLEARYPGRSGPPACDIYFVKNVLSAAAAADLELGAYAQEHPEFPRTTTVNQFYGEYDFEAYRQLGYANTEAMLDAVPVPLPVPFPVPLAAT